MASETLGDVIRRLGRLSGLQGDLAQTDAQLLERFARRREEPAFAALMVRHGPMVLGVCRRLLHDPQEAEDAFQAAFLVLARKAGGVRRQALLGGWLHGVAYRVAARLRGRMARRRGQERAGMDLDALPADDVASSDVQAVVHEEVRRLPDSYRSAVILCCLEGKTNEEAAALLRRPVGTVKSRLTRARELLRVRLTRRGMALGGGGLTAALAAHPATASAALMDATIRASARFAAGDAVSGLVSARAVALTQGVLQTMLFTKMKIAAALVLAAAILGGGAGLTYRVWAAEPGAAPKVVAAENPAPPADKPKDEAAGQGREKADYAWGKAVGGLQAGLEIGPAEKRSYAVGDTATFVLKVRNVSDGPLDFRVEAGDMHMHESPSVLDADGQRAPLSGPIFSGVGGRAVSKRTLAAGEEIEFATAKLTWGPVAEPRVTEQTIAHVKPGTYRVSYYVYYVNPDDTMNYLVTGQVEVTVTPPEPAPKAAPDEDPVLSRLIRDLGEGPIRVRLAGHGVGTVSAEEAVKAAKRAVGVDAAPEKAWRVAVTDREFMSDLVDDKPCWLLYYPGAVQLPVSFEGKDTRTLDLYVVVDAATGKLWETFTEPEAPWWTRVKEKNTDVRRTYADRGDEASADPDPPGVPLLRLLNARAQAIPDLPAGNEYGAQRKAQQVIARRFLYTTAVDTEERTEKGVQRSRSHDRRPVWTVEFDGVDLPPPVGPPGPDTDMTPDGPKARKEERPNVERIDRMWDATSGRSVSGGMSP